MVVLLDRVRIDRNVAPVAVVLRHTLPTLMAEVCGAGDRCDAHRVGGIRADLERFIRKGAVKQRHTVKLGVLQPRARPRRPTASPLTCKSRRDRPRCSLRWLPGPTTHECAADCW